MEEDFHGWWRHENSYRHLTPMEPDETKLGTSDIIDEQSELAVLMAASQYEATLNDEAT